ncbi:MAG: SufE family protein [Vampirovibrionales bacterium]|nr:SufE family protein [Vampirovibrionales bacterium]
MLPTEITVLERQTALVERFNAMPDWEARYKAVIDMGKALPEFPDDKRLDDNKVQGCQSQVWLVAALDLNAQGQKIVQFKADSDALLVKGLLAVVLSVFNDLPPAEILAANTDFLNEIGLTEHLSMQRNNGLAAVLKQIKFYALAYSAMA